MNHISYRWMSHNFHHNLLLHIDETHLISQCEHHLIKSPYWSLVLKPYPRSFNQSLLQIVHKNIETLILSDLTLLYHVCCSKTLTKNRKTSSNQRTCFYFILFFKKRVHVHDHVLLHLLIMRFISFLACL